MNEKRGIKWCQIPCKWYQLCNNRVWYLHSLYPIFFWALYPSVCISNRLGLLLRCFPIYSLVNYTRQTLRIILRNALSCTVHAQCFFHAQSYFYLRLLRVQNQEILQQLSHGFKLPSIQPTLLGWMNSVPFIATSRPAVAIGSAHSLTESKWMEKKARPYLPMVCKEFQEPDSKKARLDKIMSNWWPPSYSQP